MRSAPRIAIIPFLLLLLLLTPSNAAAKQAAALTPASVAARVLKELDPLVVAELKGIYNRLEGTESAKLRNFATLSLLQDFPAGAAWAYAKLLQKSPSDPVTANNLAWLLIGAKKLDEAQALLQSVKAVRPGWATGLSTLAKCYAAQGDGAKALAAVRKARAAAPDNEELLWQEFAVAAALPSAQSEAKALAVKIRKLEEGRLGELVAKAKDVLKEMQRKHADRIEKEDRLLAGVISCSGKGIIREEFRKPVESNVRSLEAIRKLKRQLEEPKNRSFAMLSTRLDGYLSQVTSTRNAAWVSTRDVCLDGLVSVLNDAVILFAGNANDNALLSYHGTDYTVPHGGSFAIPPSPDYWLETGSRGFWYDMWDPVYRDYAKKHSAAAPDRMAQQMIRNNYLRQLPGIWKAWEGKHKAWCGDHEPRVEEAIRSFLDDTWEYAAVVRNAFIVTRGLKWRNTRESAALMNFVVKTLEDNTSLGTFKTKVPSWTDKFIAKSVSEYGIRATFNPTEWCSGNNDYLPGPGESLTLDFDGSVLQQYTAALRATWLAERLDLANVSANFNVGEGKSLSVRGDGTVEMSMDTITVFKAAKLRVSGSWNFRTNDFGIGTGVYVTGKSILEGLCGGKTRLAKLVNRMSPVIEAGLDFEVGGYVTVKGTYDVLPGSLAQYRFTNTDVFAGVSYRYAYLKPFSENVEGNYDILSGQAEASLSEALAGSWLVAKELARY